MSAIGKADDVIPFVARTKVICLGLFIGVLFSAWCAATQVPTGWDFNDRVVAWLWYMSGPFSPILMGIREVTHSAVSCFIGLGILSIPMIAAHPIRPGIATAVITVGGFILWFAASFFTVVWAVWGA